MANITPAINKFLDSELGQDVQEGLAAALNLINTDAIKIITDYGQVIEAAGNVAGSVESAAADAATATDQAEIATAKASEAEVARLAAEEAQGITVSAKSDAVTAKQEAEAAAAIVVGAAGTINNVIASESARLVAEGLRIAAETARAAEEAERAVAFEGMVHIDPILELSQSHGSYDSLGERLDATSAQLADITLDTTNRIDALVIPISATNANVEVSDSHVSTVKTKTFSTLKNRFEDIETGLNIPATNLITNGDFSNGVTGWTDANVSGFSVTGGIASFTSTVTNGIIQCLANRTINNKYYFAVKLKSDSFRVGVDVNNNPSVFHSGGNAYEILSQVYSASTTGVIFLDIKDTRSSGWTPVYVDWAMYINLTDTFGAGKEPTATQMDAMIAVFPNGWFNNTANLFNAKATVQEAKRLDDVIAEKTSYGVISGLVVSAQTVPDMTAKITAGILYLANGTRFAPVANNALAITSSSATNPRIDIVYVNSRGVISYLAGTAAPVPIAPATPAGGLLLANVNVAANVTTIVTANIEDRKKGIYTEAWIIPTLTYGWIAYDTRTAKYKKDNFGRVYLKGMTKSGTIGSTIFTLPTEYRPDEILLYPILSNGAFGYLTIGTDGTVICTTGNNAYISLSGISFFAV